MKTTGLSRLIILASFIAFGLSGIGAETKKDTMAPITPSISLTYLGRSNDTIILTANLFVKNDQGFFALKNASIQFKASAGNDTRTVGKSVTDEEGNAVLKIYTKSVLPKDKEGKTVFIADFAGKGKYEPVSESVTAKQAKLTVTFSKIDSLRYILVRAEQVEADGTLRPAGKINVTLSVPRLFTPLKIGEVELGEDGTGKVEYPGNIVGDSLGNILVIAKIEDNDLFGNIQGQSSITWGIPKQYYLAEMPTRELWTPIAPLWMIVTLVIMLTGVWAHYFYAIIQLIMIRRSSKQNKL